MENTKKRTWKSLVAGILDIVIGALNMLGVLGLVIAILIIGTPDLVLERDISPLTVGELNGILGALAGYLFIMGLMAIIGGIYAVQRKVWGLALAGAIATTLTSTVVGVVSIVLTAMSKEEFD